MGPSVSPSAPSPEPMNRSIEAPHFSGSDEAVAPREAFTANTNPAGTLSRQLANTCSLCVR